MRFSLVVGTLGRTDELERFLASLRKQTFREFELIVADQNPDERLAPILASYEDEFPITHLHLESKGASKARNAGLSRAAGDLVAFPDDDCSYPPDLLAGVARFFSEHPDKDGLNGRSVDETGETSMGRFDAEPGPIDESNVWGRGIEYTIFVRRKSVEGLWFDEELGPGAGTPWGCGEATDFLLRLLERGASLYYDPDTVVVHASAVPPYDEATIRKAYSYGRGMGRVLKTRNVPLRLKTRWLYRPAGGAVLSLIGLKPSKARFHWNAFRGRLRGLL